MMKRKLTVWFKKRMRTDVKEKLQRLNPGKDTESLTWAFYMKKLKTVGMVVLAGMAVALLLVATGMKEMRISEAGQIRREMPAGEDLQIPVTVESPRFGEMEVEIPVSRQMYEKQQVSAYFAEAKEELPLIMAGENADLDHVRENLVFPDRYKETDISITYSTDNYSVIRESGEVRNEELEEVQMVCVKAELSYGDNAQTYEYRVRVYPPALSEKEAFQEELLQTLQDEDAKQRQSEQLVLPEQVAQEPVTYREKRDRTFLYILGLGLLCAVLIYKGMDRDLDKLYEKRQRDLGYAYPEFVSKLALLAGAGMSVTGAIRKICAERQHLKDPLSLELGIFIRNLDNGILEENALDAFGRRCALISYRKLCSLLVINMKKGSMNIQRLLESEAEEAFEENRLQIRKRGEEAATKLLVPMILMLAVVMAVIMVPAFLSYQI